MADSESGYKVGPGRPPLHTRFKKGQSGNPGGRSTKSLLASLADALDETVVVTVDGQCRRITTQDDRHADGRQIGECRHDERRRAEGRRARWERRRCGRYAFPNLV